MDLIDKPDFLAYFYDDQMQPTKPFPTTRSIVFRHSREAWHRAAITYGKKHRMTYYRLGYRGKADRYELFEEVFKVWRLC